MGKIRQSNKETKKQPQSTPKEKKAAKEAKKKAASNPIRPAGGQWPGNSRPVRELLESSAASRHSSRGGCLLNIRQSVRS